MDLKGVFNADCLSFPVKVMGLVFIEPIFVSKSGGNLVHYVIADVFKPGAAVESGYEMNVYIF